jgi:MFS family permease
MAAGAGPIVGGLLLHRFWWGSVLIVNLPVAAIAFAAAAILVPRSSDPTAPRLDRRSSLTWWVALTAALVAIIEGPVRGWLSSATIVAGVAAVVFFAAFRYNEARSPGPLVDAKTARDPRMIAGAVTMAGLFFAVFGMQFVLTQWIQGSEGWSPLVAGLCFLPNAATSIVFALLNPRMVATRGHARVASMGLLLVAVGALGSAIAVHLGSIELVAGAVSFVGAGLGIASPSGAELIMSSAPPERAGSAAGVNETIVEATGALGVAVLGSVFAAGAGFAWPLVVAVAVTIAAAIVVRRVLSPTLARSTQ